MYGYVGDGELKSKVVCRPRHRDGPLAWVRHIDEDQVAGLGARFGANAIPDRWLEALEPRRELVELAKDLLNASREADG